MGSWKLKDNLNPHECLQLTNSDDTEQYFTVIDFIDYETDYGYELEEHDFDHIYSMIKKGFVAGEVNDWDWHNEQLRNKNKDLKA